MSKTERKFGGDLLRRNILANYGSQVYSALVVVATVPWLLGALGREAYGLVGFFSLVQGWSQLLDLGLSAAIMREAACFAGGSIAGPVFRGLLRTFTAIFWLLGFAMAFTLIVLVPITTSDWLQVHELSLGEVRDALVWLVVAVALRWTSGLYKGVIAGMERQVWLNIFNAIATTLRFVAVLPVMSIFSPSVGVFFIFQAVVSLLELVTLVVVVRRIVPAQGVKAVPVSSRELRRVLRFSGAVAIATLVWVTVTQVDKAVISATIPLADYGLFTVAITAASAISLLGGAVAQALMPRLTQIAEFGDEALLRKTYRHATQLLVVVATPLVVSLAFLARPVLWAWTGDAALADEYAPILALYATGNGLMSLVAFGYTLQYARGDLRLHVLGNIFFAIVLVPVVIYAASAYGAIGSAWTWAISNCALLLFWMPLVHRRMAPGLHATWLLNDVICVCLPVVLLGSCIWATLPWVLGRAETAVIVALYTLFNGALALSLSDWGRRHWGALLGSALMVKSK